MSFYSRPTHQVVDDGRFSTPLPFTVRFSRALLYGAQVFLSFFLMLVFMTYNVRDCRFTPSILI